MNVEERVAGVMAALYLRGLSRDHEAPRKRWPQVDHALRCGMGQSGGASPEDLASILASAGLWFESALLRRPLLLERSQELVRLGRVSTVACAEYPVRWLRLGSGAPPAVWRRGITLSNGPMFTVVGSRDIGATARSVARAAGRAIAEAGGVLVSGGAKGCDREAAAGARAWATQAGVPAPVIEVLPFGISVAQSSPKSGPRYRASSEESGVQLSVAAPEEGFSSALAMERNALLYAASDRSLVVASRFREGGTWAGAVDALRRRLGSVWVWADGTPGAQALVSLGAIPVRSVEAFVSGEAPGRSLFA